VSYRKIYGEPPSATLRRPPDDRQSLGIITRSGSAVSDFA
jgi:hypothetical protein